MKILLYQNNFIFLIRRKDENFIISKKLIFEKFTGLKLFSLTLFEISNYNFDKTYTSKNEAPN